jgi:acetate---CoA ligase (ADP-forming)
MVIVGDGPNGQWLSMKNTYKGTLYSVQRNPETAAAVEKWGVKNYASVADIPEPVDLVIVNAPKGAALQIVEDCIRKDVAVVHFFTAGFTETDTEEGRRLESMLVDKARQAGLYVVGPNCMGVFNPQVGLGGPGRTENTGPYGSLGIIAQSGMLNAAIGWEAQNQGIRANKSVSFGNGVVLDSTDYLEYFASDPDIKVIGMYLEGVKDGKRFLKVLKEVTARKPVVIWKGGRTEEGTRAIYSHTASLAMSRSVWEAAVKQGGGIQVTSLEELVDTLKALRFLSPVYGDRVGIVGGSGGQAVACADVFSEAGLKVPTLTQESYKELASFFNLTGASYRNPVDPESNRKDIRRIMEILERDANVDNLVLIYSSRPSAGDQSRVQFDLMTDLRKRTSKPLMAIVTYSNPDQMKKAIELTREFQENDVPVFSSIERGSRALRNAFQYYRRRGLEPVVND